MLVGVILVIILMISLFIIYQAFNLSTNDRIQYLGMLSSVGATPKQKRKSIYFEGLTLSIIAIPLGMIISFIGLTITFHFISQLETIKNLNLEIHTKISLLYFIAIIFISLITIFISLYLPARKISKISVIAALKKNDDLKVKLKSLKVNRFSQRFFNVYQNLAIKNYKRQKRRSRVIVCSLIISMMAFVSIYSFGHYFLYEMNRANHYNSCDVSLNISDDQESIDQLNQFLNQNDKVDSYYYIMNQSVYSNDIDKSYVNIPLDNVDEQSITIFGIDNEKYKDICKANHVNYQDNQALLYNGSYIDYNTGKNYENIFHKMDHNFIKSLYIPDNEYDENGKLVKHNQIDLETFQNLSLVQNVFEVQNQINSWHSQINMIVPIDYLLNIEKDSHYYIEYNIFSSQHQELTKELESLDYSPQDYAQTVLENRQIFLIIQIFVYGFVLIMILFTMLNIMNMMSASIDNRKKELGMMLSVGMSSKGITRMLFYESFIYGIKTLIYGIPLCIGIEWLLYDQVSASGLSFIPSFIAYLISFVVIMIVMTLTFRVGLHKFRKQNIIETLKDDM